MYTLSCAKSTLDSHFKPKLLPRTPYIHVFGSSRHQNILVFYILNPERHQKFVFTMPTTFDITPGLHLQPLAATEDN